MPAPVLSRRDLDFLLYEWLNVESLTARTRFAEHSRETFDAVLDLSADMATKHFAPHNKKADAQEPRIGDDGKVEIIPEVKAALELFAKAGLIGSSFDEELGGMQLPVTVLRAAMAWFQAANAGTSSYPFLTVGNANLIATHGSEEQIATYVPSLLEGRFFGTMCLSEPQAGSSLADITTKAVPQDDGSYRLTGTKMWISGGDHELSENIVHLVLAKIPGGPAGVKGISLFIVPKILVGGDGQLGERNDVALVGLNHKMGNRGTTNTLLNFGDGTFTPGGRAGAVGYLLGEPHKGLAYMFHMMNEARIGVGFLATSLGYAGYLQSLEYARTRTQGRPLGDKDPSSPPVPLIEHADVRRMLLAQKAYVEGALALGLYCSTLVDEQQTAEDEEARTRAGLLLDMLTPVAKSWPSQWCLEANSLAIQVHGGYGYTREFDVEQFYRDNRLNPIHEGTHGIQGLDLLGRKVVMQGGAGLALLGETIGRTVARAVDAGGDAARYAGQLQAAVTRVAATTARLWSTGDPEVALANSSVYLEAVGHVIVSWMWLEQLLAAGTREGGFYDGKRAAARYFFAFELPKTGPQFDLLDSLDRTTLDTDPAWL
ncbi:MULTISPECIES: acyl-CoA dehydrogenase [Rhodococcus]|jgi:butyryl-CoA dehydrogenase|uniref:Acyl-CoA dehydrogenase n=1 Tax=Rhodococcus aetherivorans TaxID=191292 RepID=A0AA46PTS3_9NOCA|nr:MULTISPECIES: acyl-CoA dehydrogenase [Rhodococcus]ANZ26414.1 acyl-CoA dehydrogenase [Rhodococcus sp. WB1]MBC2591415.1 acyl-CoA dehydrogenase [Rhodococcus aetherivorans]QRI75643.1 acyl-CoA dehydrogenase [Rhodococcus aetherivorans]QSE59052.1 acyl-CoA dehydrogenase [Rhodococcus sp. PSBB066]QSE69626.1 acyl-CoA dehydrogenase [Rhodococcus sp. PSBB049]